VPSFLHCPHSSSAMGSSARLGRTHRAACCDMSPTAPLPRADEEDIVYHVPCFNLHCFVHVPGPLEVLYNVPIRSRFTCLYNTEYICFFACVPLLFSDTSVGLLCSHWQSQLSNKKDGHVNGVHFVVFCSAEASQVVRHFSLTSDLAPFISLLPLSIGSAAPK
jgi:hypothetical protein